MSNIKSLNINRLYDWIVILISGEIDADINFTFGPYDSPSNRISTTTTVGSCATTLNGEMYVFGGQFADRLVR